MDYKIDFFVSYRVLLSIRWKITKNIGTFKKCYVDAGYRSLLLELPGAIISVMIKNLIVINHSNNVHKYIKSKLKTFN